ncbi:spermatogenesis-defective protein 39 homolog [Amyelois transitella]|uniref:spermatogenesis-defective protein 39 homolog n=1 Tax=Amyelois transitella TaxID=680683 RepID=UPI00298F899A|nr:spermatogenesis-defective protein 39 homolog [Amyelois transitella]
MNSTADDDDYWNTSLTKSQALIFDDDVLSTQEILAIGQQASPVKTEESIFNTTISNTKPALLPISSLVSPKVLDLILQAQSGNVPSKEPNLEPQETVAVTLKRLVLGRPYSLHIHRSLKSKKELLDGAIAIGDGNAILTVVLFLIQTLNKKMVCELLTARSSALNHYISFLRNEGKITELTDLLTMLGRSSEAAIYQFQHHVKTQGHNVDGLMGKLANMLANHFTQPGIDAHQSKMVADYVKLLEWQKHVNKPELMNASPLYCLSFCCTNHWHETAGNMMSPMTVCQRQQVPPLQYDWVVLNVQARLKKWDIVESLFTKKDWLGRTTVSSHIPIEILLSRLSELQAGGRFLETCVNKVANSEDRLRFAQMYKIHSVVIETFAKNKDRISLTNYKMTLSPQSEDYILAENTLRDNSIKWKN